MSTDAVAALLRQVLRIVLWQLGTILVVTGLFALGWGKQSALSALAGGGIGVVASGYVLLTMIRHRIRVVATPSVAGIFLSWLIKTALTLGLLMVALRSKVLPPLPLMVGLFGSLVGYWLSFVLTRVKHADGIDGK